VRAPSNIRRLLPLALVALLAAVLVAGCGGSDGADENTDPQELLDETFGGGAEVNSGVLDISVDATASGTPGGSLQGTLSGPFQSRSDDELPLLDLDASVDISGAGASQAIDGSLTLTADGAYVTTGGQAYAVDEPTFSALEQAFAESAQAQQDSGDSSAIFDQLGIDPATWLTDVTNEGTEEVGGAETVHISGTPDVAKIFEDAQRLDPTGQTAGVGSADQLADSVSNATIDVYTGAEDHILRKLDVSVDLADPGASGSTASFTLSIGVSGVNEEQTIEAPTDTKPLDDLIPGGLGALASPAGLSGAGGSAGTSGAGGSGSSSGSADAKYADCVAKATTPDALTKCADQL
jgi:hypothetical protein